MPTIIDSLVVRLKLDSSEFNKGTKVVDNGLSNMAKSAAKFLSVLGGAVALKRFVENTVASNAALERFSKNVGLAVGGVSALSNAAEIAGGSAQGLQGTLSMLSKAQTELQLTGESGLIPYFSALGLSMTDAYGKALPVNELLVNIGQALLDKTGDRKSAFNMGQMMGIDEGTLNLILQGRKEVELSLKRQKEFTTVTEKQAEEGVRLSKSLIEGKLALQAMSRELVSDATPAIEMLLNAFSQFGEWIRENKEVVKIFMVELGIALGVIAVETFPIFATATAVTVLAAAIAGLVQDFNVWRKGGDSLIEWDSWEVGITAATFGVLALTRTIMALGTAMESSVIAKGATFIGNIGSLVAKLGVFTALMFHSPELNTDENEKLKKQKLLSPTVDGKNNGARTNTTPPKGSAAYLGSIEQKYGLPKGLLDSVWNTESGRGKHMNSPVGAQGHFQFMPATSKQYGLRNPYDFESSADAAGRMYRDLIDKYHGDTNKALAAYNWGQGNVDKKGMGRLPLETSGYINKVLNGMPSMSNLANSSAASKQGGAIGANVSTTETHIGEVKIYTQTSNDASVIAKDIKSAVDKTFTSSQANYGMN